DVIELEAPACGEAQILVRIVHLSLDPYVGSRIRGRHMGEVPPEPGAGVIPGAAVAQVVESKIQGVSVGDWVHTMDAGWREYAALDAGAFRIIDPNAAPLAAHAGVLGMPGLTAWSGITQLAKVGDGDVVLVDAAAGTVGGTVGQIARLKGASKVIGIAGGPDKCAMVVNEYGFDACVDYKQDNWTAILDTEAPDGVSVHFENVGVSILNQITPRLKLYGRAILCGLAEQYHSDGPPPGLNAGMIVGKRAAIMGLIVYDFYPRWDEYVAEAGPWVTSGSLKFVEDRMDGLETAPALFEKLMNGQNMGKCVVGVASEQI
ncbi:MAG: NADP-dependent oxidoreductase, partial [Pseudomonadota bacterium]